MKWAIKTEPKKLANFCDKFCTVSYNGTTPVLNKAVEKTCERLHGTSKYLNHLLTIKSLALGINSTTPVLNKAVEKTCERLHGTSEYLNHFLRIKSLALGILL